MKTTATLLLICVTVSGCSQPFSSGSTAATPQNPANLRSDQLEFLKFVFPNERSAILFGEDLECAMFDPESNQAELEKRFLGRDVALAGAAPRGAAGGGGNADLSVGITREQQFRLHVMIDNYIDVRPRACWWSAGVLGTVRRIDYARKIVTIDARPRNWVGGDAG